MIHRATALLTGVLAFTLTSSAFANDIEDFVGRLLHRAMDQRGHHDDHDDDHHGHHGQNPQFGNHFGQGGHGHGNHGPQFDNGNHFEHGHDHHDGGQFDQGPHFDHGPGFPHAGHSDHGHQFTHGQKPQVLPYVNPGIEQPKLDINGHYVCGQGIVITRVICGGLAERLGLERGDAVFAINGETIQSREHFHALLMDAVVRHGGQAELLVRNVRGYPEYVVVRAYFPSSQAPVLYHQQW